MGQELLGLILCEWVHDRVDDRAAYAMADRKFHCQYSLSASYVKYPRATVEAANSQRAIFLGHLL